MDEPLFGDNGGAAVNDKGALVQRVDGQTITFLDGRQFTRRLGSTVTVPLGDEKINVRPGSHFMLCLIDELVRACVEEMFPVSKQAETLADSLGAESTSEIVSMIKSGGEPGENDAMLRKIIVKKAVDLYTKSQEMQRRIKEIMSKTRFQIAQMIVLDAKEPKGDWKMDARPPTDDELERAMPTRRLVNEFASEDVANLIHVYWQLNFSEQEKKDFLSLRMAI